MNSISSAVSILVSIEGVDGVVYNLKKLALYNFNGNYISEPLSLKTGTYQITDYIVLDSLDNVIFVTPKAGLEKAYLVQNPLPIGFTVQKDSTVSVMPELISADTSTTPEDYGYMTFGFNVINTFEFKTSAFVFSSGNFSLTTCNIFISNNSVVLYDATLDATVNTNSLKDLSGDYVISATKTGYENYSITMTNAEMKTYESVPYSIILSELDLNPSMIFIQNGTFNMGAVGCTTEVHPIGQKNANELGIYDMSGNVWEWCWDWYSLPYSPDAQTNPKGPESGTKRVDRGGGWSYPEINLRTETHFGTPPTMPSPILGFRLVRVY